MRVALARMVAALRGVVAVATVPSAVLVAAALSLAVGHLVPAAAIPGTVNWVAIIAS